MFLLGDIPEDRGGALRWGHAHKDFFLNPTSGVGPAEARAFARNLADMEASMEAEQKAREALAEADASVLAAKAAVEEVGARSRKSSTCSNATRRRARSGRTRRWTTRTRADLRPASPA